MFTQRILLAFDGTDGAIHALEKTKELAKLNPNTSIHILYVNDPPKIMMGEAYVAKPDPDEGDFDQEIITKLAEAERELLMYAPTTSEVVLNDNPEKEIIEQAERLGCDLIIIGSRGLGGLKKLILGSISSHVVNNASVPVLVIK